MARKTDITGAFDETEEIGPAAEIVQGGMWARDKLYGVPRLDSELELGERCIVFGAGRRMLQPEVDGKFIDAAWLCIAKFTDAAMTKYDPPVIVQTIATAIVRNTANAIPADFPAIVETALVKTKAAANNEAYVLNYKGPWLGGIPETLPDPVEDVSTGAMADGRIWDAGELIR